jgi:hypothetical protein
MEPRVDLDEFLFQWFLERFSPELDDSLFQGVPRSASVLRFCETRDGRRTGRRVVFSARWEGDTLFLGWLPLAVSPS